MASSQPPSQPPSEPDPWMLQTFESAITDFKSRVKGDQTHDFSQCRTIHDVYDEARRIQDEQRASKSLRGLRRIDPYLKGLAQYQSVIEVFVQAKPEILCLIWVHTA